MAIIRKGTGGELCGDAKRHKGGEILAGTCSEPQGAGESARGVRNTRGEPARDAKRHKGPDRDADPSAVPAAGARAAGGSKRAVSPSAEAECHGPAPKSTRQENIPDGDLRQHLEEACLEIQIGTDAGREADWRKERATLCLNNIGNGGADMGRLKCWWRAIHAPAPESNPVSQAKGPRAAQAKAAQPLEVRREAGRPQSLRQTGLDSRSRDLLSHAHYTHTMLTYRGLAWCNRCGCTTSFLRTRTPHLRKLKELCEPPTAGGERNLRQLRKDPPQLIDGLQKWPEVTLEEEIQRGMHGEQCIEDS